MESFSSLTLSSWMHIRIPTSIKKIDAFLLNAYTSSFKYWKKDNNRLNGRYDIRIYRLHFWILKHGIYWDNHWRCINMHYNDGANKSRTMQISCFISKYVVHMFQHRFNNFYMFIYLHFNRLLKRFHPFIPYSSVTSFHTYLWCRWILRQHNHKRRNNKINKILYVGWLHIYERLEVYIYIYVNIYVCFYSLN